MFKSVCIAASLLLLSPLCAAEVFKCTKDGGRTVYQNFPCEIDSIGSAATQPPPAAPAVTVSKPVETRPKGQTVATVTKPAAPDGEPHPGMTPAEVRASKWGEPVNVIRTGDPEGLADIWVYGDNRTVVFNSKGRVGSVKLPSP